MEFQVLNLFLYNNNNNNNNFTYIHTWLQLFHITTDFSLKRSTISHSSFQQLSFFPFHLSLLSCLLISFININSTQLNSTQLNYYTPSTSLTRNHTPTPPKKTFNLIFYFPYQIIFFKFFNLFHFHLIIIRFIYKQILTSSPFHHF